MKPKKKSMIDYIIYGICLVIVLFFALHGAIVYETVKRMVEFGEIESSQQILMFIDIFSTRISASPFNIQLNQYTQQWLIYGGFGWLIVVLAIESSKKNYIHGKEYGTSRWGTQADIRDLFASTLEALDIKRAKQMKTKLGRWKVKSNIYKECEQNAYQIQNVRLKELKEAEELRKIEKRGNETLYKEEVKKIKEETKKEIQVSKLQAWKPDQLKLDYETRLKEIKESTIYSDEDRKKQEEDLKKEYDKKLDDFYNVASRVAAIKQKYKDADMLFTKTERISFYNYVLNQNTLIIGGSGSGKTRGFVMPNILQAHSSYIITDPKGEILEKSGKFLSEVKGYKIRVLNLDDKQLSDGYNPFVYIQPNRSGYEERVLSLIETIIVNTEGGEKKGGSDPFWPMAERLFLQSVFFFTAVGFVPEEQNMNTLMKLIAMLEIGEEEDNRDSDLDRFVDIFAEKFGDDHIGVQQFREFRSKASGKTAKSIVVSAVARLAPFKTSEVRRIFSYDSMQLDRVGEEKTAIFVVVPPTDDTFNFIAGMFFTQLFQELQYCASQVHKHDGQRLPVPVRFILDEFKNTCKIPNFVKILAYARSFGIGITPILQSLDQIKEMYEKEWGVILDNCNTLLYLGGINHMDTLEYMSKLIGKGTFDKRTTGRTKGRSGSSSQNYDVVGRELMTASEIREMPKKDCLFVVSGRPVFYSEKYRYEDHPNYRFTSDANSANSYHYVPAPPPKIETGAVEEKTNDLKPSESANAPINPIECSLNKNNQLDRMVKNHDSYQQVSDDELGERYDGYDKDVTTDDIERLKDIVAKEEAVKEEMKLTVSQETEAYLDKKREERIEIELGLFKAVNRFGRIARHLVPVPDNELSEYHESYDADIEDDEIFDESEVEEIDEATYEAKIREAIDAEVEDMTEILNGILQMQSQETQEADA